MEDNTLKLVREGTAGEEEVLAAAKEIEFYRSSIIVPGKDRPDLLVSVDRFYLGNTFDQANKSLTADGYFMLAPRYFVELLNHLRSGKPVYGGGGKKLDSSNINGILGNILTVRDPWRSEWLDARFGKNTIAYHKINPDRTIVKVTEPLDDCLMENRLPEINLNQAGIDLDSWLRNPTEQGLPRKDIGNGSLWYWYPRKDTVTRFGVNSLRAALDCYMDPLVSDPMQGVRRAKIFEQ